MAQVGQAEDDLNAFLLNLLSTTSSSALELLKRHFELDAHLLPEMKEWVQRMKDWCCSACLCFFCFVLCSLIR